MTGPTDGVGQGGAWDAARLRELVVGICGSLPTHAGAIGDLDAALGDGDLGITVTSGCAAVGAKVAGLPDDATPAAVISAAGLAFASANPSTMAALVGQALRMASKTLAGKDMISPADAEAMLAAAIAEIQKRGGAELGDKTIVDAMAPTLEALRAQLSGSLDAQRGGALGQEPAGAIDGSALADVAGEAVQTSAAWQSRRGRASWQGERTVGQIDPGAMLFFRFMQELAATAAAMNP